MRAFLPLVLLLVGPVPALAEEETVRIGLSCDYWNSALTGDAFLVTKVLFIRGAYEGATAFHMDIFDAAERAVPAASPLPVNTREAGVLFEQRYLRQTSYLTLVERMNEFCSDAQNASVWLTGALKVISMRLRGDPVAQSDAEVLRLRTQPGP